MGSPFLARCPAKIWLTQCLQRKNNARNAERFHVSNALQRLVRKKRLYSRDLSRMRNGSEEHQRSVIISYPANQPFGPCRTTGVEFRLLTPFQAPLSLRLSRAFQPTPDYGRRSFAWFLARKMWQVAFSATLRLVPIFFLMSSTQNHASRLFLAPPLPS